MGVMVLKLQIWWIILDFYYRTFIVGLQSYFSDFGHLDRFFGFPASEKSGPTAGVVTILLDSRRIWLRLSLEFLVLISRKFFSRRIYNTVAYKINLTYYLV